MNGLQRKLFRDFKSLRVQVITIAILIVCGVSVLVSSWSSYQSLQSSKEAYYQQNHFADVFAELVRAPDSLLVKLSRLQGVEQVEKRVIKDGLVDIPGQSEPAIGHFVSWNGEHQLLNLVYLRQGRMPQKSTNIEVLVHESFATAHHLKMGDSLKVLLGGQQRKLIISGIGLSPEYVYALSPTSALPDDKHFGIFWMRQDDLESMTGMSGAFNSVQFKVTQSASLSELKRQIDQILQPYGSIQSYDRNRQLSNIFVEDEIKQQRVMAMVMPAIFLAVAMFILNIILSRLISLHRGQIATLKSLGYSSWALAIHYFQLVTLILLTGIGPALLAGAYIGKWYAGLYQEFFRFPVIDFSLSWGSIGLGLLAGLVPGWLGASGALIRVFTLLPAEALRPPSPAKFNKGLLEKLGLASRMGVLSKMILRSLLFRPIRTGLSVLGIAASLAIVINGSFWTDVIDYMLDRQFQQMRREDLSIQLIHPQKQSVFSELKSIPGVVMCEGERNVPVRLEFRNMKKEMVLLGRDGESQLSRVMDQDGNIIQPVEGGVILSRYFETRFGIRTGDEVHFKVLQGNQKDFNVPVVGFVDDLIGQQGYVVKKDLHRWLNEEPVIDMIQMKIDPLYSEKIYVELNEKPEVASVSVRKLLIQSFSKTIADMIITFTFILYFFAVAIAGAVMYNSARISFSERAWEMASLRILGYGVGTAFELLFVDIGLQVLIALIPGLALGYWLSYLSTHFIHNDTFIFPLVFNLKTYAAGVLVLLLTFAVSGFFLYRNVIRLDFSEALKARE